MDLIQRYNAFITFQFPNDFTHSKSVLTQTEIGFDI